MAIVMLFSIQGCKEKPVINRLSFARSPYLKEHADNPVDWYEWGDEALLRAKKENKPLLISIGYAACHWCHVMEKESFMDTAVAREMNDNFICIKVDREERPDIDKIYTNASELISGSAGWPLNAFALPDGKPFFAGTYFPTKGWISLLQQITKAWKTQPGKISLQAISLANGVRKFELSLLSDEPAAAFSKEDYSHLTDSLLILWDPTFGGLKGAPKFPTPYTINFLLQHYAITKSPASLNAATTALSKMAMGGIYDHAGGGFARYSVDSMWQVPHFEKMLYDNAQLLSTYAHAFQITHDQIYADVMQSIIDFAQRDLLQKDGAFFSSLNADTRDGEGSFYAFTRSEANTMAKDINPALPHYFNITENGNWEKGKSIPFTNLSAGRFAASHQFDSSAFAQQVQQMKRRMLEARGKREKPSVDNKILTSWNALMIKGLADAYMASGKNEYLQSALRAAQFIETRMMGKQGRIYHSFFEGQASIDGLLEDYAYLAEAFIQLYQVTFDIHWLQLAERVTASGMQRFFDPASSMFFSAANADMDELRTISLTDNSTPSPNAVMANVLFDLSVYKNNEDYLTKSRQMLLRVSAKLKEGEAAYLATWAMLSSKFAFGVNEVAIVGKEADQMNKQLQQLYWPNCLFLGSTKDANLTLLEDKYDPDRTIIYVCTGKVCKRPVANVPDAVRQLQTATGR